MPEPHPGSLINADKAGTDEWRLPWGGFSTFYWRVAARTAKAPGQFTGQEALRQSPAQLGCWVPPVTPGLLGDTLFCWQHRAPSVTRGLGVW